MSQDKDDLVPTSFSSIPRSLIDAIREIVEPQGVTVLRPIYEEAINDLCDALDAGMTVKTWPMTRPGLSHHKATVRISRDVWNRMRSTVAKHNTRKGVFFRVALIRWLSKNGVEWEL